MENFKEKESKTEKLEWNSPEIKIIDSENTENGEGKTDDGGNYGNLS